MEFDIKLWKNLHYKKRKLVIREKDFQIIKIHHENKIQRYLNERENLIEKIKIPKKTKEKYKNLENE